MLILCTASASAQLLEAPDLSIGKANVVGIETNDDSSFASDNFLSGILQIPSVRKAESSPSEAAPVFVRQDALTLAPSKGSVRKVESITDFSVLQEASAYKNAARIKIMVSDEQASGIQAGLAQITAAYQKPAQHSDSADCSAIGLSVEHQVKMDSTKVLSIVESEIGANPGCACEIVKTAIKTSGADEALVADIAEVAITAAPESMRMISQCAIAAMPDALAAVQAVLAKLDPNSGDTSYSSKGSKSGKEGLSGKDAKAADLSEVGPAEPPIPTPNPLDIIVQVPRIPPPPLPPVVTDPDPNYYQLKD